MPYKKGLEHIPYGELVAVTMIGSWILDRARIDAAHKEKWEQEIRAFKHPAAREAGLFFLCGEAVNSEDAKLIVAVVKAWNSEKHEHLRGLRKPKEEHKIQHTKVDRHEHV